MTAITKDQVSAVILAGGMGRRMGGQDKGQVELQGQPLIEYVLNAIRPQVKTILINAIAISKIMRAMVIRSWPTRWKAIRDRLPVLPQVCTPPVRLILLPYLVTGQCWQTIWSIGYVQP